MLKFIKHNLETIAGVDIYPIISLLIFFTAFVLFTVWAFTYSKEKIKEIVNGFDEVQKEVKVVTDTIITQRDYISSIFEQTRVSDDILLEIHNKLINHVERASKVDTNLEEALTKLKNLL